MATKRDVLAACRKRWPKHQIQIRVDDKAPSPSARERLKAERDALVNRKVVVRDELKRMAGDIYGPLMDAAQFVIDVNGDDTALVALQSALTVARTYSDLREEDRDLEVRIKRIKLHRRKCSVSRWDGTSIWTHGVADGDTLDECLAKVQRQ